MFQHALGGFGHGEGMLLTCFRRLCLTYCIMMLTLSGVFSFTLFDNRVLEAVCSNHSDLITYMISYADVGDSLQLYLYPAAFHSLHWIINLARSDFVWRSDKDTRQHEETMKIVSFKVDTYSMLPDWSVSPLSYEPKSGASSSGLNG